MKIAQLLLFSISVYWLYYILINVVKNKIFALTATLIYGLSPLFIGFLYYILTEGITPSLLILFIFLLFKAYQSKKYKTLYYLSASIIFSYLFVTRPVLGVFSLLIPLFIIIDYWSLSIKKKLIKLFVFGFIAFSLMFIWQFRNYKISGNYVGLNPIYDTEKASLFRPPFHAYWIFSGSWGEEGHKRLATIDPFWNASIHGDTSKTHIDIILNSYPDHVINFYGKQRLITLFKKYQTVIINQKTAYQQHIALPKEMPKLEIELVEEINQLTTEYKKEFWLDYHIISPLKVFKTMAFHSNLSLYIFQHTYRGIWWMETIRFLFFALHSICFLVMLINLFNFKKEHLLFYGLNFTVFIYVFYLCYFQRGIEERYTLPILPILLIGTVLFLKNFYLKIKAKF